MTIPIDLTAEDFGGGPHPSFGPISAIRTQFLAPINLVGVTWIGPVVLDHAEFHAVVNLGEGHFHQPVSMHSVRFHGAAIFNRCRTEVSQAFECRNAVFAGYADFADCSFRGTVNLMLSTFQERASFVSSTFAEDLTCSDVSFVQQADFANATFHGQASFIASRFQGDSFWACQFLSTATFQKVVWSGIATFTRTAFHGPCHCAGMRVVETALRFREIEVAQSGYLDFTDVSLVDGGRAFFEECKLDRVLFRRTDCREIEFRANEWAAEAGRAIVFDEIARDDEAIDPPLPTDGFYWNEVAIIYQELAKNFRDRLHHPLANDFEHGVFRMRLQSAAESREYVDYTLVWLYRSFSDYGASALRPALWLLGSLVFFAVVYHLALHGGYLSLFALMPPDLSLAGLRTALVVSLLQWRSFIDEIAVASPNTRVVLLITGMVQALLTTLFSALFAFAVRRRFQH